MSDRITDGEAIAILNDAYDNLEMRSAAEFEAAALYDNYTKTALRSASMIERYNRIHPKPQESPPPAKLDTPNSIEAIVDARIAAAFAAEDFNNAIGEVVAHERKGMRDRVSAELRSLRRELAEAKATIKKLERAKAPREIVGWKLGRKKFRAIPFYSNGKPGTPIPLRPLFEEYDEQTR